MTTTTVYPCGVCWCPCGQPLDDPRQFFKPGHDKVAEAIVMQMRYGTVAQLVAAEGFGPGRWPAITCDSCGQAKPITKFPTAKRSQHLAAGRAPECRTCRDERRQAQR